MSSDPLALELIEDVADLDAEVVSAWDELAVARSLPYSRPGWMLAWSQGASARLARVIVVRDGGRIVGIGPFTAPDAGSRGLLRADYWLLGAGIGPRSEPLAIDGYEERVAAVFAKVLAEATPRATVVRFAGVDAGSPWARAIAEAWPGTGARMVEQDTVSSMQVVMHPDGYEAWLQDRSPSFRRDLRRPERAAEAAGVSLRISATPDEAAADIAALVEIQRRRFSAIGRPALPEGHAVASAAAAAALVERGGARVVIAEADGKVVAADANFAAGSRMAGFMLGLDPGWERLSLGRVVFARAIRDAHELGMRTLDLGTGKQAYKLRFASADEPLAWQIVRPRSVSATLAAAHELPDYARRRGRAAVAALPAGWQQHVGRARSLLRSRRGGSHGDPPASS